MATIDDIQSFTVNIALPPPNYFLKWVAETGVNANVSPVTCDINNDGIKELFIAGNTGNNNTGRIVCVNGSNGNLIWEKNWSTSYQDVQTPMAIGDLAGDGKYKIVHTASTRTVARNCEDGSIFWDVPIPSGWHHLAIVDADKNGLPYVYVAMHGESGGSQKISKIRGYDGVLVAEASVIYPCYGGIAVGDINNDGEPEILINDGYIKCFDKNLKLLWSHACSGTSACPVLYDVNGDGYLDVISIKGVSQTNGGLMIISGKDGTIMKNLPNIGLPTHMTPTVYDIDKDGHPELITAYGGRIKVFDLITEQIKAELNHNGYYYRESHPPSIANAYSDNDLEIVVAGSWDGQVSIWNHNYQRIATINDWGTHAQLDDIDGDGYNELLLTRTNQIICWKTPALSKGARNDVHFYGERRTNSEIYYPKI